MCGRYYAKGQADRYARQFHVARAPEYEIRPSYNIAPQTVQTVVRKDPESGEREFRAMCWGLVPFWSKDGKTEFSTINARAETISTSPVYRDAWKRRRCLVVADGFYEWQKVGAGKQPYAIGLRSGEPCAFAGLWESWTNRATNETKLTYSIITTGPNALMMPERGPKIHDRMPVIVAERDYERWLADLALEDLPVDHLRPYPAEEMTAWKVSVAVGSVRNNSPDLCAPM